MKVFEDKYINFSLKDCVTIDYEIAQLLVQREIVVNEEYMLEDFLQISKKCAYRYRCQNWSTPARCGAAVVSGGLGKMVYIIS